jgi:hypothetical protein
MSTGVEGQLIALMRLPPSEFEEARRRGRVVQWLVIILGWIMLASAAFLLQRDVFVPDGSVPLNFPDILAAGALNDALMLVIPFMVLAWIIILLPSRNRIAESRVLRDDILAGESMNLPAVLDQPPPLEAAEHPQDIALFDSLKPLVGPGNIFIALAVSMFSVSVRISCARPT